MADGQQRADRNALVQEGYFYAQKKGAPDIKTQTAFGDLWADHYAPNGYSIEDAWEVYKS